VTLPVVCLFATGGTIASTTADGGRGYRPALRADELLNRIPEHSQITRLEIIDFSRVASEDLTPTMALELCGQVNIAMRRAEVAAAVVTHGTGTLEDTCFLADLFIRGDKPFIGTGAMFSASASNWDGGRNLLDSLLAAVAPASRGKGVLLCMNGELHAARDAVKMHASSPSAFESPGSGPIGCVDDGQVVYYRSPTRRYAFPSESIDLRVEVVKIVQGSEDRLLRAALALGIRGLVIEGLGGRGTVPAWLIPAIREARAQGVVVVLCTRSPRGRVAFTTSARMVELGDIGVISGGDLPAHKARLLLMAALAQTSDENSVRTIFSNVAP